MGISVNTSKQQVTASVTDDKVTATVSSGFGPTGPQGGSGVVAVTAPITNSGTSSSATIGLSVGTGLQVSSGSLAVTYGTSSTTACVGDDARLGNSREWSADTIAQAEAEAGAATTRRAFTAQRVFQAIAAWWAGSAAKTKLDGIATGATANATDAQLRDRSTHTGTQTASTISDFTAAASAASPVQSVNGQTGTVTIASFTLQTATNSVLGGVKIGTGVTIADGVISVSTDYAQASHTHVASAIDSESAAAGYVLTADGEGGATWEEAGAAYDQSLNTGDDVAFHTAYLTNGDTQTYAYGTAQLAFGYADGGGYRQWITTTHNAGDAEGNRILFHTCDGTVDAAFPGDAILGLMIEAGTVTFGAGGVRFADNTTQTTAAVPYSLPTASGSVLGGVKIGTGLSIDGSSVLSATYSYTLPAATASTLGGVIVGTGLGVSSGTVSVSYGTSSSTACVGNDARLSDARTPTAHNQAWSTITSTPTSLSGYGITDAVASNDARLTDARTPTSHTHGNITNAGAIGTTSGQIVVTTTGGALTTSATIASSAVSGLGGAATLNVGTTNGTVAAGDHTHSQLHDRSHAMTGTSDHTAGNWRVFHSNGSGQVVELALGASGTVLTSGGTAAAPSFAALPAGGTKTVARFDALDNQPPASNFATLDTRNSIAVLDFDDATKESAVFAGVITESASLGSGLIIRLHWMATSATSNACRWEVSLERSNTDLDSDSFDTVATAATTTNGTSGIVSVTEITLTTIDSVTAGDLFRLRVARDAANAADTMTGDAELVAVEVRSAA